MKERILALVMAAVMTGPLTACSGSSGTGTKAVPAETEAPASESKSEAKEESKTRKGDAANIALSKGGSEGYELALVADLGTIDDKSFSQSIWEGLEKYVEENSISYKYYQPQESTTDSYLETIGLAIEGGTKLVACPGFLFEKPICLAQDKYPDVHFILLDGEPHDAGYNHKINDSITPILFQEDQAGFLANYAVAKDGYTEFGFMGDMAMPTVIHSGYGFVQGAEFAAEKDGVMGLEVMYNYIGAFSATLGVQSMTASRYQNDTEVIFGYGETVGNSVAAAAQEKDAKVTGVGVDQGAESETVTVSAMRLLSNSVYDEVKDFYDGSFPGGKTSVFTVANNGVGLPMGTSKFEKFSQEQCNAIYKKLADGETGLVRLLADNNDPTRDLTDLTNTKITFVEQGLVAIRAIQGPEMTCGRQS